MIRLAVLIPVYNGQRELEKSLNSLEPIDGVFVEVVVVDDGSREPLIGRGVPEGVTLKLIRLAKNQGIVSALNTGLEYIVAQNFDFIARLDAGDVNINSRINKQINFLVKHSNIALLGSYVDFVNEAGAVVFSQRPPQSHRELSKAMYSNNCFCHPAVMFRVCALEKIGFYSSNYPRAEDYEIFWRFVKKYETATIPETLLLSEAGIGGISRKNRKEQLLTRLKIQRENFQVSHLASWIGLVKTSILLFLPLTLIEAIKGLK